MKDIPTDLAAHIKSQVTTLCTCVMIRRKRDNKSFHFTDHDRPVDYRNQIYVPYNSFTRFSVNSSVDLDVDGMEIRGMLRESGIYRDDIASGLFDHAEVEVFMVNYVDPDGGKVILRRGWLGEVVMDEDSTFRAEIRGLSQVYAYRVGEAYSPECRADLGDRRCKIGLNPEPWKASTTYCENDIVLGVVAAATSYLNVSIINDSFEDDFAQQSLENPTGWTTRGDRGAWATVGEAPGTGFTAGRHGDLFLVHANYSDPLGSTSLGIYQDINLVSQGAIIADLDSGLCRMYFDVWVGVTRAENGRRGHRTRLYALDENNMPIGGNPVYDSGFRYTAQGKWYQTKATDILLPTGTRSVRIDLESNKSLLNSEGCVFDQCKMVINTPSGTYSNADQYGGVMFKCITGGTTGTTEPAWTNLHDQTFTDGSVVWQCVPSWKTVGVVSDTDSSLPKEFSATGMTQATGWFDGGLLIWETGLNAGRVQEMFTYVNGATKDFRLFQRPFYPITVGDRFVIHPGCDKRRATCIDKFSNIINFRGEPDVPGTDEYIRTPNAEGGTSFLR